MSAEADEFCSFNPLNAELNSICHLLALLGAHHILRVSGVRVNILVIFFDLTSETFRRKFPNKFDRDFFFLIILNRKFIRQTFAFTHLITVYI